MLEGMGSGATSKGSLFQAKLVGILDILPGEDGNEWLLEDDEPLSEEYIDVTCSVTPLFKKDKIYMRRPWKQALIIKLLGPNIGYHILLGKITDLWIPKANFDLVAMEHGYFSVKFSSMDDYEYVKYGVHCYC